MRMAAVVPIIVMATACSSPTGPYPSLQPRSAEAIDPRIPVVGAVNARPPNQPLVNRLSVLLNEAQAGDQAFNAAIVIAERLAALAAAPHSESWIAAEESLTAAIAARRTTSTALGDIDEIGAIALRTQGGIAPNDLAAIQNAQAQVGLLDRRQAARIEATQKRLGN